MSLYIPDELHDEVVCELGRAVGGRVTGGGCLGIGLLTQTGFETLFACSGYTEVCKQSHEITPATVFDLASLTKPLVTLLSVLILVEDGILGLESSIGSLLPSEFDVPKDKRCITIRQLLSHSSGLPAHRNYFVRALNCKKSERKRFLVSSILNERFEYQPGKGHIYSDLGYILLGVIVEQLAQCRLNEFFELKLARPLGLDRYLFFPGVSNRLSGENCAATEICPWTHKLLCGTVHDDNCRVIEGVAGHAGVFGTVGGVVSLCTTLNGIWLGSAPNPLISPKLLREAMTRVGKSTWCLGFDSPSKRGSTSGRFFSEESVGHLGFTGTSFWIDLRRGVTIVLLTNRVHPSRRNEKIRNLRPEIHDLVMERLLKG